MAYAVRDYRTAIRTGEVKYAKDDPGRPELAVRERDAG
jgi:hypothetical protein